MQPGGIGYSLSSHSIDSKFRNTIYSHTVKLHRVKEKEFPFKNIPAQEENRVRQANI